MAFGAVVVLAAIVSSAGIYNNLANVRQFQGDEILSQFWERLLVQPSELGWISYERVFSFGQWQPDRVFDFLFQAPLDASRNTTPQFLMLETIGEPRTYEHISGGFQFAGGFPEIFFELFGPVYAWPFIFGAGYIAAGLTAVVVKGVIQGRYRVRVSVVVRPVRILCDVYRRNAQLHRDPGLLDQDRRSRRGVVDGGQPGKSGLATGSVGAVSSSHLRQGRAA